MDLTSLLTVFFVYVLVDLPNITAIRWGCRSPAIDATSNVGVQIEKLTGSRVEVVDCNFKDGSHMSLQFKTKASSGLLYLLGSADTRDTLAVFLHRDHLRYSFRCGSANGMLTSQEKVNDGKWHKLEFTRLMNGDVSLTIDGDRPFRSYYMSCSTFKDLYLGGVPANYGMEALAHHGARARFNGCIRGLFLDGTKQKAPTRYVAVSTCT